VLPVLTIFLFLAQPFPTRAPQNIVISSARNCGINIQHFLNASNDSKYTSKCRGNFYPAVGNIGVISVRYKHPLFRFGEFVFKVLPSCTMSAFFTCIYTAVSLVAKEWPGRSGQQKNSDATLEKEIFLTII
jgi:hypothetical protein